MKKTYLNILNSLIVIIIIILSSCTEEKIYEYKVVRQDFINDFVLDGTIKPKDPIQVFPPKVGLANISYIIDDGTYVKTGDTLCILKNDSYNLSLISNEDGLRSLQAEKIKSEADIKLNYLILESNVRNNDIQSSINEMDSLQRKFSTVSQKKIIDLKLQINKIRKSKLYSQLNAQKIIDKAEMMKINLRIKNQQRKIEKLKKDINSLVVLAPAPGIAMIQESFMGTGKFKDGDAVYYMFPVFEIPDFKNVYVNMVVTESFYKRIAVGQNVKYSFDAMPNNFGSGKILMKAPGRRKKSDKMSYFSITSSITKCDSLPLPGMSANCKVSVNMLKDTIIIPNVSLFDDDGDKIVYIKSKKSYVKRHVLTGPQSSKYTVVSSGLEEGDVIAMVKPKERFISQEKEKTDGKNKKPKGLNINSIDSQKVKIKNAKLINKSPEKKNIAKKKPIVNNRKKNRN